MSYGNLSNLNSVASLGSGSGGSSGFSPGQISGIDMWLQSDSGVYVDAGVTLAVPGNTVEQWSSILPATLNLLKLTSSARPTYTSNSFGSQLGLAFDGTSDFMTVTVSAKTAQTLFFVIKSPTLTDGNFVFSYASDAGICQDSTTGYGWISDAASGRQVINAVGTAACVITLKVVSAASMIIYSNGTQSNSFDPQNSVTTSTNFTVGAALGGSPNTNVTIASILRYTSALSDSDRQNVERYLGSKYGITVA